jgi:hypothetical protein
VPLDGGPTPAVSVGTILGDAAAEDEYDKEVKKAQEAVAAMKLGSPDPSEGDQAR